MSTAPINGLVGIRGFGRVSLVSLSGFGLISVIGSLVYHCGCDLLAAAASMVVKQAAAATKLTSPTKIASEAILYYFAASSLHMSLLVREKMWWWLAHARKKIWWWIASFGESYHGDVLQYAKQLFSLRLLQMTKYCVMRECNNIHWISLIGDLALNHQHRIYGFKLPKRFFGDLLLVQRSPFFSF
jgi:hypothetical protein